MSGVALPGASAATLGWRSLRPVGLRRVPSTLLAILVMVASYQLALRVSLLGLWPDGTAELVGRATLAAAGKADPSALLASYPPVPYVLLLVGDLLARPLGLDPVALVDAVLLGGLAARYGRSLAGRGASTTVVATFVLLLGLHPLAIGAVAQGPQALLLVWGGWLLGRAMIDTRTVTGINDTITLTLALPMLAMTSAQGAVIAIGAVPFLILAVPRDLAERNYAATYVVLLFPLVFSVLCLFALSALLLHTSFAVVIWDAYREMHAGGLRRGALAGLAPVATAVVTPIAVLLATTRTTPLALRESAAAALAGLMFASILVVAAGIAVKANEILLPTLGLALAVSTRWPLSRVRQVGWALLAGVLASALVLLVADAREPGPIGQMVAGRHGTTSADQELGRYLAGRRDVMIDVLAHPAVVAGRGSADGLLTDRSPRFGVSVMAHRVFAPAVAVRAHRPGESDDAISRSLPRLFDHGAPGYRLAFDRGGWRVWVRARLSEIP